MSHAQTPSNPNNNSAPSTLVTPRASFNAAAMPEVDTEVLDILELRNKDDDDWRVRCEITAHAKHYDDLLRFCKAGDTDAVLKIMHLVEPGKLDKALDLAAQHGHRDLLYTVDTIHLVDERKCAAKRMVQHRCLIAKYSNDLTYLQTLVREFRTTMEPLTFDCNIRQLITNVCLRNDPDVYNWFLAEFSEKYIDLNAFWTIGAAANTTLYQRFLQLGYWMDRAEVLRGAFAQGQRSMCEFVLKEWRLAPKAKLRDIFLAVSAVNGLAICHPDLWQWLQELEGELRLETFGRESGPLDLEYLVGCFARRPDCNLDTLHIICVKYPEIVPVAFKAACQERDARCMLYFVFNHQMPLGRIVPHTNRIIGQDLARKILRRAYKNQQ